MKVAILNFENGIIYLIDTEIMDSEELEEYLSEFFNLKNIEYMIFTNNSQIHFNLPLKK